MLILWANAPVLKSFAAYAVQADFDFSLDRERHVP